MDKNRLHEILTSPYNIKTWRETLLKIFNAKNLYQQPQQIPLPANDKAESASEIGRFQTSDEREIGIFQVNLKEGLRLEKNKVGIRQLLKSIYKYDVDGALITFTQSDKWRLSFVSDIRVLNSKGEIVAKETVPKRYTFLLGKGEKTRTASERLLSIAGKTLSLEDIRVAFSVEKMSKSFFDEYKAHYEKFCVYLQDSVYRTSVFRISIESDATKEEKDKACKPIRDFTKKLLGRIVFLYFVQKKGWLGASRTEYKDGSSEFIRELFISSGADDSFYPAWLSILFFDTLNKEREKDDFTMPDGSKLKIPYLNGGLFDKEKYENDLITLPSFLFHNPENCEDTKQRSFLDFLDSYNFTIYEDSPDEHTVAVDPEMLSHIFENLLEDNKDKGAFYTPKEIVHYMCQESLIEYLTTHLSKEFTVYRQIGSDQIEFFGNDTKTGQLTFIEEIGEKALNRNDVENIVRNKDFKDLTEKQLKRIDELLDSVKICDPAIGSGAFPMGLLKEIFGIKELIAYMTDAEWNPSQVKLNIIQNSIYGVDIEKGAVDIARLRFWLSLIVDEEYPKPLPNLDYKIVVGDSLISKFENEIIEIDWNRKSNVGKADEYIKNVQKYLKEVAVKQKEFFSPKNKNKKMLHSEIRNLKIELLINQVKFNKEYFNSNNEIKGGFMPSASDHKHNLEIELQIANFNNLVKKLENLKNNPNTPFNHFDWKLDFPEILNPYLVPDENQRGFDIMIGNPPYIDSENMVKNMPLEREIISKFYKSAKGNWDIYIPFHELAIKLLKINGTKSYITPNKWISIGYGEELRDLYFDNIFKVCNCNKVKVFEAGNSPIISFFRKEYSHSISIDTVNNDNSITNKGLISKKNIDKSSLGILLADNISIIQRIKNQKNKVIDYINSENPFTTGEAYLLIDIIEDIKIQTNNYFKLINTGTIDPYINFWGVRRIAYLKNKYDNPVISKKIFKEKFPKRYDQMSSKKIIISGMRHFECFYDQTGDFIAGKSTIILRNPKNDSLFCFLMGILNSKLIKFYIYQSYSSLGIDGGINFTTSLVDKLPIPDIDKDKMNLLVRIVDYYLIIVNEEKKNEIKLEEAISIIDGMVYELYFPELIRLHDSEIIKHLGHLPKLTESMNDEEKMEIVKDVYGRLNAKDHPVRNNLKKMKNEIKEIRIVEGTE